MKDIAFSRQAKRTLQKMPSKLAMTIIGKIEQYALDPTSLGNNVKALKGAEAGFRLRVGDWRVLFDEDDTIVDIVRIAPRGSAYG